MKNRKEKCLGFLTPFSVVALIVIASQVVRVDAGQDLVLKDILENHIKFKTIKASVKSEQIIFNKELNKMELGVKSSIEVIFGPSSAFPAKFNFTSRKSRWFDGLADYYVEKKEVVLGENFTMFITHEGGAMGRALSERNKAVISNTASKESNINHFEVGDGFLLMNQKIFGKIPITRFGDIEYAGREDVSLDISKDVLNGEGVIKISFTRSQKSWNDNDVLYVSLERGFALVRREYFRAMDGKSKAQLIELRRRMGKSITKGNQSFKEIIEIDSFEKMGDGYVPSKGRVRNWRGDQLILDLTTVMTLIEEATSLELENISPEIPVGYRVSDERLGISYEVGASGPELIMKINKVIGQSKK